MYYVAVPLTLFVVLLQVSAAPAFTYLGAHADLPLVWLSCWGVIRNGRGLVVLLAVSALGLGLLGHEPLGASLFALMPLLGLVKVAELRAQQSKFVLSLIVTLVGGLLFTVILAFASIIGGGHGASPAAIAGVAPRAAALDVVTAAIWFWPMWVAFAPRTTARGFRRG